MIKKILYDFREIVILLALLFIVTFFSIQLFNQPVIIHYLFGVFLSFLVYVILTKLEFDNRLTHLAIVITYVGFITANPLLLKQSVFETIKVFLRGNETSIFIRNQLSNIYIPTSLSTGTLSLIVLWTMLVLATILVSFSIINWLTEGWFFVENLVPPLLKPISTYLEYITEIKKSHIIGGLILAICLFILEFFSNSLFPTILLMYTNLTFNVSLIIFGIFQVYVMKNFVQVDKTSFVFGNEVGIAFFAVLLNLIFMKRGVTKKVVPIKKRLRTVSVFVFGIALLYIVLYLLLDTFALNVFPFVILIILCNSVFSSRIEAEFQVLFTNEQLSIVHYMAFLPIITILLPKGFSPTVFSILAVSSAPLIPAILTDISSIASLNEKKLKKSFSRNIPITLVFLVLLLFSIFAFHRYSSEIYSVKSYIPHKETIEISGFYMTIGATITFLLGFSHLFFYRYPLNPMAFLVSSFFTSIIDIIVVIIVSTIKMLLIKNVKTFNFTRITIVATIFYAIFNIVKYCIL